MVGMLEPIRVEIINASGTGSFIINIITSLIGVLAGGILTYLFTLKAQKKHFSSQIKNTARIDISKSLRDYYLWLIEAKQTVFNSWDVLYVSGKEQERINQLGEKCEADRTKFLRMINKTESREWITMFEIYNSLFPEYCTKRIELTDNHNKIVKMFKLYISNPHNKLDKKSVSVQLDLISNIRIQLQDSYLKRLVEDKII